MTIPQTLERAARRGLRVRIVVGGETFEGRVLFASERVVLLAPLGSLPRTSIFVRGITSVEVLG